MPAYMLIKTIAMLLKTTKQCEARSVQSVVCLSFSVRGGCRIVTPCSTAITSRSESIILNIQIGYLKG